MKLSNKTFLICLVIGMIFTGLRHAVAQAYTHSWSKSFGDSQDQLDSCISVDHANNVLITGYFRGNIDFGGGALTSAGYYDVFLAKFDSSGSHLWSKAFGDSSGQYGYCVAVDSMNNIIIIGTFAGSIDFGGGTLNAAGADIFLAKLDSNGNHIWSQRFGDLDGQEGVSVTVDSFDNVIMVGHFWGTVDFGGELLISGGDEDIYLAKFDSAGNHIWSKSFGDSNSQGGACVVSDSFNRVIITGGFYGSVDFGGGVLTSAGSMDIFLAKFDANGNHIWSKRFGDSNAQNCRALTIDYSDNLIITRGFKGTIDFGAGPLSSTADSYDVFLAKFDTAGNHIWSHRYGDLDSELSYGVNVDSQNNIVITGGFDGSLNFGEKPLMSAGGIDIFLAKFTQDGNYLWSNQYGGSSFESGSSLICDSLNNLFLLGDFTGSFNLGGEPLICAGGADIFLAKFDQRYETPALDEMGIFALLGILSFLLLKRCN